MGKTILTSRQLDFLELAQSNAYIAKNYYLTGGTALAAFYYSHRLSEDIDLFSEKQEIESNVVEAFLKKIGPKLNIIKLKGTQTLGLVSFKLIYNDGKELKVDLNYYPFPRIEIGTKYKNLGIDSIYDIAANKIHTIFMKPRLRDYIDIYFILSKEKYNFNDLIINSKAKFDWDIDKLNLAAQFLRVKDFEEILKMRKPFKRKEMENFFLNEAKKLKKEIFKD